MRRLFLLLSVAALALSALPGVAGAQGADIYGVGAGSINLGTGEKLIKFAFSGHTGPRGDFGQVRFTSESPAAPFDVHVDVDCVNVRAFPLLGAGGGWMAGAVKKVTPQPNAALITPGMRLLWQFNDFGEPSDPVRDQVAAEHEMMRSCKLLPPAPAAPISQGNVVVKFG